MTGKILCFVTTASDSHYDLVLCCEEFHHTGFIENVNSLNNKYCSKTYVFG